MVGRAHDVPVRIFGRSGQQQGSSGQQLLFLDSVRSVTALLLQDLPERRQPGKGKEVSIYTATPLKCCSCPKHPMQHSICGHIAVDLQSSFSACSSVEASVWHTLCHTHMTLSGQLMSISNP